jgi:glycosyltransferase involved in cell wall biosynthesis
MVYSGPRSRITPDNWGFLDRVISLAGRDLPRRYADLNVLVVSSDNEGTPVSGIEAMASGVPVVGTRVGGLPDMITDCENGFLVPPRNPESLAEAILRLLRDPEMASRMGRAGQTIAKERFKIQRLISNMEGLYQNLLIKKGVSI